MISPLMQQDDDERVRVLGLYDIAGTKKEKEYDLIAELANSVCGTKISMVSFIDADTQWFKAYCGTDLNQNTRELAICSHAINDVRNVTYIPNLTHDIRFKYNPMVTALPKLRFYAGVPIISSEGYALGTVCVMDTEPMKLTQLQLDTLTSLRDVVSNLLKIRRENSTKEATKL